MPGHKSAPDIHCCKEKRHEMKLRYFIAIYTAMAFLIPFHDKIAACGGTEEYRNWVYMFGHAGWLHYMLNGIGWLMMWKIATPTRTACAYLLSVSAAYMIPHDEPVLGWSTVIFFYTGMCLAHMPRKRIIRIALVIAISFFIPHIAALMHLYMLIAGWMIRRLEIAWKKTE